LIGAGRLHETLADCDRASELYRLDAQALNNRGITKLKLGDREGARADWVRALELQPGMKEAEENLRGLAAASR
jgi:Flp pilus assembly protein TadD